MLFCLCCVLVCYLFGQVCYLLVFGYYLEVYGYYMQWCVLDDYLLIYCCVGCGWLECVDECVEVGGGDLLVLFKGLEYVYGVDLQWFWSIYWVYFEGFLVEDFLCLLGSVLCLCLGMQLCLLVEFDVLLVLCCQGFSLLYFIYVVYLLQGLFILLVVCLVWVSLKFGWVLDIDVVQVLMCVYLYDSFNFDELVVQFKLLCFYFVKIYCVLIGQVLIQDFIQMKMVYVCCLFDEGVLEVWQIVEQFGYVDFYYFLWLFCKVVGMVFSYYWVLYQGQCFGYNVVFGLWVEIDKDC